MATERATPLLALHRELGAKLTEFAGWDMPLQYEGIIAEHNAVRNSCGLFDVSHRGKLRLGGESAQALQQTVTCDAAGLEVGRASYALVLTDAGGCVDDVFVYRLATDDWLVVPNASNVTAVAASLRESGAEPLDQWDRYAILALQGPDSFEVFDRAFPDTGAADLALHRWKQMDFWGAAGLVARTGYTGERGFELYVPAEVSERAMRSFLSLGVTPVGLGARDTLRLEMGYALYGHEIDLSTNPLEAGLGWAIDWDTPFRGKEALEEVRRTGPARKLFGAKLLVKGVPRQGHKVLRDDQAIGEVVSGNFSPTLGVGIAMAYAPSEMVPEVGEQVTIEARGRMREAEVAKPPFIRRGNK